MEIYQPISSNLHWFQPPAGLLWFIWALYRQIQRWTQGRSFAGISAVCNRSWEAGMGSSIRRIFRHRREICVYTGWVGCNFSYVFCGEKRKGRLSSVFKIPAKRPGVCRTGIYDGNPSDCQIFRWFRVKYVPGIPYGNKNPI